MYVWVFILFSLTKVLFGQVKGSGGKRASLKNHEQKHEEGGGWSWCPCLEGEALGLFAPVFLPGLSKCSGPKGSGFIHGIPVRQVVAFQQMVI